MSARDQARRGESGLSLAEVLVALLVLSMSMAIALSLYDLSRKSVKRGESVIEQQQVVRIAADILSSDLRMAGFNTQPDGTVGRPDEPFEAAYDTALVLRADFDQNDVDYDTPEDTLATGGAYHTVSTGNDEIIVYALAKPDGSSADTLSFYADVGEVARDGDVEQVQIPKVALVHDDPPYTLYKITLSNDPDLCCDQEAFSQSRMPLAENIRSLGFRYFDRTGAQINLANDLGDPSDDIGGGDSLTDVQTRKRIHKVGFDLEALTRHPDQHWIDPDDPAPATRAYRKFRLQADVIPRNAGRMGLIDLQADEVPPSAPAEPTLVPGHCEGMYVKWAPNDSTEGVEYYRVLYGETADTPNTVATSGNAIYLDGLSHDEDCYVEIQAADADGNLSSPSPLAWDVTAESTDPESPTALTATDDLEGQVLLAWEAVNVNSNDLDGDLGSPVIRDLERYAVYRRTDAGAVDHTDRIAEVDPALSPSFTDDTASGCRTYYYTVKAIDLCNKAGGGSPTVMGKAVSNVRPAIPQNVEAFFLGGGGSHDRQVRVTWSPVTEDVGGNPMYVDEYKIFRSPIMLEGSTPSGDGEYSYVDDVTLGPGDSPSFEDGGVSVDDGETVFYQVTAKSCGIAPDNESGRSQGAEPSCSFDGTVIVDGVPYDHVFWGEIVRMRVTQDNAGTYTFSVFDEDDNHDLTVQPSIVDPDRQAFALNPDLSPGTHTLTIRVESNGGGCVSEHNVVYEIP